MDWNPLAESKAKVWYNGCRKRIFCVAVKMEQGAKPCFFFFCVCVSVCEGASTGLESAMSDSRSTKRRKSTTEP